MSDITTKEIYELIDSTRKEISSHVLRLETKFDTLEAGRVSALEKELAQVKAEHEPVKRIVYGLVSVVLLAVLGAILALVIKQ